MFPTPIFGVTLTAFTILSLGLISAQQFENATYPMDYPGLSTSCLEALNTTVACPASLGTLSLSNSPLNPSQLSGLCVDDCYSSLSTARRIIQAGCVTAMDVMVYNDIAYPATYIIDHFLYSFNISCRQDKTTGVFCDTLLTSWQNESSLTPAQACSDCVLGLGQLELGSPFAYDNRTAEQFVSSTSSCNATGYAFTSPAPYALNGTATQTSPVLPTSTSAINCTKSYVIDSDDTCVSTIIMNNVSTFSLLYTNNLNIYCANFPTAGSVLCIPPQCDTYTLQVNDTCLGIVQSQSSNITVTQLQAWNPNINTLCGNLDHLTGSQICVSPPGGWLPVGTPPPPMNTDNGTCVSCGRWYTINAGDCCTSISTQMDISLQELRFLNPEINANCSNLTLGKSYCVAPVGSSSGFPNYTNTESNGGASTGASATPSCFGEVTDLPIAPYIGGNVSFLTLSNGTQPSKVTPTIAPITLLPTAPGTIPGCAEYRNYQQTNQTITANHTMTVNSCNYLSIIYEVEISDLETWNPTLSRQNCTLQASYSYCVQQISPAAGGS